MKTRTRLTLETWSIVDSYQAGPLEYQDVRMIVLISSAAGGGQRSRTDFKILLLTYKVIKGQRSHQVIPVDRSSLQAVMTGGSQSPAQLQEEDSLPEEGYSQEPSNYKQRSSPSDAHIQSRTWGLWGGTHQGHTDTVSLVLHNVSSS